MAVSIIDGEIEQVVAGRQYPKVTRFKSVTFRERDGQHRTLKNLVAMGDVAASLTAGRRGRFYVFSALDVKGIYGVRLADGASHLAFPASNNKTVAIMMIVVSVAYLVLKLFVDGGVPLLSIAMIILGGMFWFVTRKAEREAQAQFDADRPI